MKNITDKLELHQIVEAKFASLNKNNTLKAYITECNKERIQDVIVQEGGNGYPRISDKITNWSIDKCRIDSIVNLNSKEYDEFIVTLMKPQLFLTCKGGFDYIGSNEEIINSTDDMLLYKRPDLMQEFRRNMVRCVTLINCKNRESFVVDPQGYNYARYVGL